MCADNDAVDVGAQVAALSDIDPTSIGDTYGEKPLDELDARDAARCTTKSSIIECNRMFKSSEWIVPDREWVAVARRCDYEDGNPRIDLQFEPRFGLPVRSDLCIWLEPDDVQYIEGGYGHEWPPADQRSQQAPSARAVALDTNEQACEQKRFVLRLPTDTHRQLLLHATARGISANTVILLALRQELYGPVRY